MTTICRLILKNGHSSNLISGDKFQARVNGGSPIVKRICQRKMASTDTVQSET